MKYQDLYAVLNKKWKESADKELSKAELAGRLGLSVQTLVNWENNEKELTATQVANLLIKATDVAVSAAHLHAVRPIVEIFPIDAHQRSQKGGAWDVFDGGKSAAGYMQGLKDALQNAHGIYIFYDSSGDALYAGKARKQFIWAEMNNAFNRSRKEVQEVMLVNHPVSKDKFVAAHEKSRQPRPTQLFLHQLAHYFSAYEVEDAMIDDVESLLVRAFPNNLLNVKMERFTADRQLRQQNRAVRVKNASAN